MYKVALALLVGLMLSFGAGTWAFADLLASEVSHSNPSICNFATHRSGFKTLWTTSEDKQKYVREAKRRSLTCGVDVGIGDAFTNMKLTNDSTDVLELSDFSVCKKAVIDNQWDESSFFRKYVREAKRRGLSCGVSESGLTQVATTSTNASGLPDCPPNKKALWHDCFAAYTYGNGNRYVGEFKHGKKHGQGTYTWPNGGTYLGEFRDGKKHGQGTYIKQLGGKYSGAWKDDKLNGHGTEILRGGNQYIGEFKDNKYHGKGIFTYADGRASQEGIWEEGEFQFAKKLTPSGSITEVASSTNTQTNKTTSAETEYQSAIKKINEDGPASAEAVLLKFLETNAGHSRAADARLWLGRVQFAQGKYEYAAMTFSKFHSDYPEDARLPHATLWIADAVSNFAPRDQACAIYQSLPDLLDAPPVRLIDRLRKLANDTACVITLASGVSSEFKPMAADDFSDITTSAFVEETKLASSDNTPSNSAELDAERKKRLQAEAELAALKAQQQQQQQIISSDTQVPLITITSALSNGPQGTISGRVTDNTGVGEVRVDGQLVALDGNGGFTANTYVPEGGVSVTVEAFDLAGLSSSMFVQLDRVVTQTAAITFDRLNPLGKQVKPNKDALALIVGVADYENTPAKAIFADSDALTFRDYASEKLGIPENRIKTLVDDGAGERELLLAVKSWITRSVKQEQSDVYVFFAGHGLASDDGSQMYLLPYDGAPELLEETTISREKLFTEVAAANPRSVTVFLDTCYSGQTRNEEMLIASRPLVLVPKQQAVPDNFTVMTAAAGDQTAKPLEEAKHGMFSYFLMKGMEGEADANQDNKITAGELHAYVEHNVDQQSSGSQTPELQGDADRVLVQFQ